MRPRDVFEAACHAALTKYKEDVAAGTWLPTADGRLVDRLLKAWERSMLERVRYAERGLPSAVTSPEAAAARIRAAEQQVCQACARREAAIAPALHAVTRIKAAGAK